MKSKFILLPSLFLLLSVYSFSQTVAVYTSGTEGHKSYRIPAIVSLPKGSSNDYMFLYSSGQRVRASTQGVVFLNIGKAIRIYWLYTSPDLLCRGLGGSIVDKLFLLFPDKLFQLCSKRESAPFWNKKGFVPSMKNRREE